MLSIIVGVGLIVLALRDIFDTLFHPHGRGVLSERVIRVVWRAIRSTAGAGLSAPLTLAGPLAFSAVLLLWVGMVTLGGAVLNVACGERITVNELAEVMAELMGRPDLKAEHLEERAGDVKHSLAALEAGKTAIGYEPIVDFRTGLKPTVAWYEDVLKGAGA